MNHGLELAGPGTKGGVLISLLQPPRNQTFENGFTADLCSCRTTNAIKDLIRVGSNENMTIDDVSTFDTLPYSPEGSDESALIEQAEHAFCDMVKAKKPDVVLCCYQGDSNNDFIRSLGSLGVGKVFRAPDLRIAADCITKRVNAFHPSYAINYQRTYSCFRRLLLLEFVKAFSHSVGEWKDEEWMVDLRSHCETLARNLYRESNLSRYTVDKNRWKAILEAIQWSFSRLNYFNFHADIEYNQQRFIDSNLSWNCADASLFLDKVQGANDNSKFVQMLLDYFVNWCKHACEPSELRQNYSGSDLRGYFDPNCLSKNTPPNLFMGLFSSFLRDINLSFQIDKNAVGSMRFDLSAQRDAFRRMSINSERRIGQLRPTSLSDPLSDQFRNLGLNSTGISKRLESATKISQKMTTKPYP